jgi:hypothetical protein
MFLKKLDRAEGEVHRSRGVTGFFHNRKNFFDIAWANFFGRSLR